MSPPPSPPDNSRIYEQRVQDSLSRFLERVGDPAQRVHETLDPAADARAPRRDKASIPPQSSRDDERPISKEASAVLRTFTEELGRILLDGTIWTVWQSRSHMLGAVFDAAGPGPSADGEERLARPAALDADPKVHLPTSAEIEAGRLFEHGGLKYRWIRCDDGAECVRIGVDGAREMVLWLRRPKADVGSPAWRWLWLYTAGLKSYFFAVRALMQTIAAVEARVRRTRYEAQLRRLRSEREKDFSIRLADIARLLDMISRENEDGEVTWIDLAWELAVILVQELMGTGWVVRQVGPLTDRPSSPALYPGNGSPADSHSLKDVSDVLERMVIAAAPSSDDPRRARKESIRRRLTHILRSLRALVGVYDPMGSTAIPRSEEALSLLPVWTGVHEACRALCRPRPGRPDEYDRATFVWGPAVVETLAALPLHLQIYQDVSGPDEPAEARRRGSPSARNWLSLWFALQVLASMGPEAQLNDRESCALHADVAYVLREGLRFACFGERGDYFFQPSTYAAALRRLVEHHAHHIVGVPRDYNIVHLLDEIGDQDGLNRYMAAEHLQHVLEVYIAGHFVMSVQIQIDDAATSATPAAELHGQTIAEALTSGGPRPNPERVRLLKQAYSLASLFHDVGHLLFPRDSVPHDSLYGDDPEIAAGLQKVGESVNVAGNEVAQTCFEQLGLAYYSREELARFRDELEGPGGPNHGLLGAWYLHRVGVSVLERADDLDGFADTQREILRMAVRAVLFHGASTGQIRSEVDPVATVLVLCNEVFEWDPGRHAAPAPSSIGRSFHVMAADVPAREPRDARIGIKRLTVRPGDPTKGELHALLGVDARQKSWPELHVILQVPQRLDVPVLRLWLAKAQSLGRLTITRHGLCPTVVMRSQIDVTLSSRGLTTKSLLDRVAERRPLSPIRPALRAWLSLRDRFEEKETPERSEESVRLGPLEQRLLFENLHVWLRRIEEEAWVVVQSIDADSDEPSSRRWR